MTQPNGSMQPPALPLVTGILGAAALLDTAKLGLPTTLSTLLSSALKTKQLGMLPLDTLYDYAHGDQIGKTGGYWKGRKPADGNLTEVLPQLVQDDQIGPSMGREVDSLFGKEPEWDAVLNGKALDADSEFVVALALWHKEAGLTNVLRDAARIRWWAGRLVLRVYIPDDYAEQIKTKPPKTLPEALELIHVESVDPRNGGPLIDAHGRVLGYWNRYVVTEGNTESVTYVELYSTDKVRRFRQTTTGGLEEVPDFEGDNPMQGAGTSRRPAFLMWHADRDGGSSITLSARDAQDRLNVVNTYAGRNDEQTGYRQFIVANAIPPTTPDGRPAAYQMGPGVVVNLLGETIDAVEGVAGSNPQRHTPTWEVVDPLNPENYHIPSIGQWKKSILEKFDQLWTLSPDVQVSGESKRQSRKPFDKRVTFASQDVGGGMAWALKAAVMLASMTAGIKEFDETTFTPKMYLDVDAANLEELKVKLLMRQAGELSRTTLLEATPGVTDVAQEEGRIEKEQAANPVVQTRNDALQKLMEAGAVDTTGQVEAG